MPDTVLELDGAVVQHGPASDRVYVMELDADPVAPVLDRVEALARTEGYGKVVVKARASDFGVFALRGYRAEAVVPRFFGHDEPGVFFGRYLDRARSTDPRAAEVSEVIRTALDAGPEDGVDGASSPGNGDAPSPVGIAGASGVRLREATPADAEALADGYASVFESYPFPIDEAAHLRREMSRGTRFFLATEDDALVAASSMEPGGAPGVVEMTDFATLPSQRGRGLATALLALMDHHARADGLRVAYTIARAASFGMNITFARRGYRYGGTLVNNTQIGGTIESMNVWYKLLSETERT